MLCGLGSFGVASQVVDLNGRVQATGGSALTTAKELLQQRHAARNIEAATQVIIQVNYGEIYFVIFLLLTLLQLLLLLSLLMLKVDSDGGGGDLPAHNETMVSSSDRHEITRIQYLPPEPPTA